MYKLFKILIHFGVFLIFYIIFTYFIIMHGEFGNFTPESSPLIGIIKFILFPISSSGNYRYWIYGGFIREATWIFLFLISLFEILKPQGGINQRKIYLIILTVLILISSRSIINLDRSMFNITNIEACNSRLLHFFRVTYECDPLEHQEAQRLDEEEIKEKEAYSKKDEDIVEFMCYKSKQSGRYNECVSRVIESDMQNLFDSVLKSMKKNNFVVDEQRNNSFTYYRNKCLTIDTQDNYFMQCMRNVYLGHFFISPEFYDWCEYKPPHQNIKYETSQESDIWKSKCRLGVEETFKQIQERNFPITQDRGFYYYKIPSSIFLEN